ncbi:hypothetical protein A9G48_07375 [Gilliamella sp. wkB18]|uniref:acyltransferase family protein n=1 Tax=Gilliamella sp. wkB18 TaxID=3120260 RepID=UPI0004DCB370|nr:acyltransferase family protein [Gilliamella apicola]KFA59500.1 hypothetical protein GAPWKB11_0243 [Gilliamella apicola]OCG62846.1 hypothetical protein A9G48_07375 [Gilliamella apicola]
MELKYRSDIDGLRAFAVIAVIAYHLNHHWLHGGFIGVDIFFVISGFLITKIIYGEIINNTFSFKNFYQRRINRILPVFFFVMLFTAFFSWYILLPNDFMLFFRSLKSTTYFWENMFFAKHTGGYWDSSAESMPILHTWSLAVEEQFYIILPFILLLLLRLKQQSATKIALIVFVIIAFLSFLLAQISPLARLLTKYNYYSLLTGRAGELLIGSILGILSIYRDKDKYIGTNLAKNNVLTLIGFIGISLSVTLFSDKILFPSFWAIFPTISTGLILYFYHPKTIVSRLLSLKPIVFIGKISYSLYLWHWPIIVLSRKYLFVEQFYKPKQYFWIVVGTLLISILTYYFIERPCRLKKRSFKFSLIVYYILPVTVILTIYYAQKSTKFLNTHSLERLQLYYLQTEYLNPAENFCMGEIKGNCIFGDKTKQANILLFGDSHSGHYSPYLDEAGKKYGFAVKIINSPACTFLPEQIKLNVIPSEFKRKCLRLGKEVTKAIQEAKILIYAGRYNAYSYNKKGKQQHLIINYLATNITKYNKKTIVLSQAPWINVKEHEKFMVYFLHNKPFKSKKFITNQEKFANAMIQNSIYGKAIFFDPLNGLNEKSRKEWPIYKGLIAYSHDGHLNEYVTRLWSQEVLPTQQAFWQQLAKEANE